MIILLLVVVFIYFILGVVLRDKNVSLEVEDEVMQQALIDYVTKKKLLAPAVAEVGVMREHNYTGLSLLEREKAKRKVINTTFLLGVASGTRLRENREKYIQIK